MRLAQMYLHPLSVKQLKLFRSNDPVLEKELGIEFVKRSFDDHFSNVLDTIIIPNAMKNVDRLEFYTIWVLIDRAVNCIVGSGSIKGYPDGKGAVDIGYGIDEAFQNQGYATRLVDLFIQWAMDREEIKIFTAKTDITNFASRRVLEKNGFELINEDDSTVYWQRKLI